MTQQQKIVERLIALVTAVVILLTAGAALVCFLQAGNVIPDTLKPAAMMYVLAAIIINVILSGIVFFWTRSHLGTISVAKGFDRGFAVTFSWTWDVIALIGALVFQPTQTMFIVLGIILIVDFAIDFFVHIKR